MAHNCPASRRTAQAPSLAGKRGRRPAVREGRGHTGVDGPETRRRGGLAVPQAGTFRITIDLDAPETAATVKLRIQTAEQQTALAQGTNPAADAPAPYPLPENGVRVVFPKIQLKASPAERLETWVEPDTGKRYGVKFVYVERVGR